MLIIIFIIYLTFYVTVDVLLFFIRYNFILLTIFPIHFIYLSHAIYLFMPHVVGKYRKDELNMRIFSGSEIVCGHFTLVLIFNFHSTV